MIGTDGWTAEVVWMMNGNSSDNGMVHPEVLDLFICEAFRGNNLHMADRRRSSPSEQELQRNLTLIFAL